MRVLQKGRKNKKLLHEEGVIKQGDLYNDSPPIPHKQRDYLNFDIPNYTLSNFKSVQICVQEPNFHYLLKVFDSKPFLNKKEFNSVLILNIDIFVDLINNITEHNMEIAQEGVKFKLDNFGADPGTQNVTFTHKDKNGDYIPGTTNEEVIDMMISRYYSLNKTKFSPENQCCLLLLKNIRQIQKKRLSNKVGNVIKFKNDRG